MRSNGNMALQALYELISELMDELERDEVVRKAFEKIRLAVDPNLVAFSKVLGRLASCEVMALRSGTSRELVKGMEEEVKRTIKEITGENAELETELRNGIYVRGSEGTDMDHFSLQIPSKDFGRVMILTVSSVNPITEEDKDFLSAVVSQMGIAFERSENFSRVERIAHYDDLTGVFRRRFFFDLMEDEFRKGRILSLLMFDVDRFSHVNNSFGHHKGDECLVKFAEVLKRNVRTKVRKVDHVGRYGGDEFVMLIDRPIDEGALAGERVRVQVESSPVLRECGVTTSVGVSSSDLPGVSSYWDVIKLADEAAYQAKDRGRNRVCYWEGGKIVEFNSRLNELSGLEREGKVVEFRKRLGTDR